METITINATNSGLQVSSKMRGRSEISFEGIEEGMESLFIEVQHFDDLGTPILAPDVAYETLLAHNFADGKPAGFVYDKRNSAYRLRIYGDGIFTDTNYNVHIA